jgi:pyrimidine deaminase RibD-like protein
VKSGARTTVIGPKRNDGTNHAEELLLAEMNQNWSVIAQPRSTGVTNSVVFNITRSPCGDMPKAHNCASQIRQFVASKRTNYLVDVEVRAASIYFGKFRKASREAIKKLADAGIKFTAWDLIAEMGDDTEVDKETLAKLQKRIDSTKEALPDIIKVGAAS